MVLVTLLSLIAVSWTGLKADQAEGKGPLAGVPAISIGIPVAWADGWGEAEEQEGGCKGGEEFWEEAHEASVNFMLLRIVLHLGGVTISSLVHRGRESGVKPKGNRNPVLGVVPYRPARLPSRTAQTEQPDQAAASHLNRLSRDRHIWRLPQGLVDNAIPLGQPQQGC
jgi:hypothetical protein